MRKTSFDPSTSLRTGVLSVNGLVSVVAGADESGKIEHEHTLIPPFPPNLM